MRRQTVAFGIYVVVTAVSGAGFAADLSLGLLGASIGAMTRRCAAISLYVVYAIGYKDKNRVSENPPVDGKQIPKQDCPKMAALSCGERQSKNVYVMEKR
ncbi:MAG: hypothetical protein ACLT0Y_09340 [Christensenellales bacterium]